MSTVLNAATNTVFNMDQLQELILIPNLEHAVKSMLRSGYTPETVTAITSDLANESYRKIRTKAKEERRIEPGVEYTGTIIKANYAEENGEYDRWSLDLALFPTIADDKGIDKEDGPVIDVIEVFADPKIIKQEKGTFNPNDYLGKMVRVVLGNCVAEDTHERYITTINLIPITNFSIDRPYNVKVLAARETVDDFDPDNIIEIEFDLEIIPTGETVTVPTSAALACMTADLRVFLPYVGSIRTVMFTTTSTGIQKLSAIN